MKVTPAKYSHRWREMLKMLKDHGAKSEVLSRTVGMTFVADIFDGEIVWQEFTWTDADNKALASWDILVNRNMQGALTTWLDETMILERSVGESQRAQKRLK